MYNTLPDLVTPMTQTPPAPNNGRTALLLGGSGLVGGHLLKKLLEATEYKSVIALVRRPLNLQHDKLTQQVIDFEQLAQHTLPAIDDVFCCLGTTIKVAGSRAAFRRVDHDYVLMAARSALKAGARQFLLVSSLGANANSPFFYMRTKGETETALRALPYAAMSIFQPAYLVGQRSVPRPLEDWSGKLMQRLAFLMPAAYRPIHAASVAQAMLDQARQELLGYHLINPGMHPAQC